VLVRRPKDRGQSASNTLKHILPLAVPSVAVLPLASLQSPDACKRDKTGSWHGSDAAIPATRFQAAETAQPSADVSGGRCIIPIDQGCILVLTAGVSSTDAQKDASRLC